MGKKENRETPGAAPADPARSIGRVVGLCVGVAVGLAAATTGLVAGIPAPDVMLRAVGAGLVFKIAAGACGVILARSLMQKPGARGARPEGER
jgi:uncharacterized membrane protein YeaQ/YmgE (transglycosylase-associated protein family)